MPQMPPATHMRAAAAAATLTAATAAGCSRLVACSQCCCCCCLPCYRIAASLTHVDTGSHSIRSGSPSPSTPFPISIPYPLPQLPLLPAQAAHIIHSYHQRSQRCECCKRDRQERDRQKEAGEGRVWQGCAGATHQGEMSDGSEYRAYRQRCHCVSVTSSHPRNVSAVAQLASTSQLPPSPYHCPCPCPSASLYACSSDSCSSPASPCRRPLWIILHIRRVLRAVVRVIASPKPVKCEVLFVCATARFVCAYVCVSMCVCECVISGCTAA